MKSPIRMTLGRMENRIIQRQPMLGTTVMPRMMMSMEPTIQKI